MAYRNHSHSSRRYYRSHSHSTTLNSPEPEASSSTSGTALPPQAENVGSTGHTSSTGNNNSTEHDRSSEHSNSGEKKKSQPFGFLTSLFGSGDRGERGGRSGKPIFTVFDRDIYFDDLLLAGLIVLLMSDKFEDEILILILAYLLIDII